MVNLVENMHVIVGASGSAAAAIPKDGNPFRDVVSHEPLVDKFDILLDLSLIHI